MENNTIQSILAAFEEIAREKHPVLPEVFLDGSIKLTMLIGNEQAKLFDLQQQEAREMVAHVENGDSVAKAKLKVQAGETHKLVQLQEAMIERVWELIRQSKLRARMSNDELHSF